MVVILDVQGFKKPDNKFLVKELAAIKIERYKKGYIKRPGAYFKNHLFNGTICRRNSKKIRICGVSPIIVVFHGMPVMYLMMNSKKY